MFHAEHRHRWARKGAMDSKAREKSLASWSQGAAEWPLELCRHDENLESVGWPCARQAVGRTRASEP